MGDVARPTSRRTTPTTDRTGQTKPRRTRVEDRLHLTSPYPRAQKMALRLSTVCSTQQQRHQQRVVRFVAARSTLALTLTTRVSRLASHVLRSLARSLVYDTVYALLFALSPSPSSLVTRYVVVLALLARYRRIRRIRRDFAGAAARLHRTPCGGATVLSLGGAKFQTSRTRISIYLSLFSILSKILYYSCFMPKFKST